MPRHLVDIRPIFIVRVAGEVDGLGVTDLAIDGLSIQVLYRDADGAETVLSCDLLEGVDTYDANVIRLLENLLAAMNEEAAYFFGHRGLNPNG